MQKKFIQFYINTFGVCIQIGSCKKIMTFTVTHERLTALPCVKGKVALDHDGFRSGNFGRKGTFFSSQTKGNVVLDQDGFRSGNQQDRDFLKIPSEGKVVIDHVGSRYFGRVVANQGDQEIVTTLRVTHAARRASASLYRLLPLIKIWSKSTMQGLSCF